MYQMTKRERFSWKWGACISGVRFAASRRELHPTLSYAKAAPQAWMHEADDAPPSAACETRALPKLKRICPTALIKPKSYKIIRLAITPAGPAITLSAIQLIQAA